MKPITQDMLVTLIDKLRVTKLPTVQKSPVNHSLGIPGIPIRGPQSALTQTLRRGPAESPSEIAKLQSALAVLSSDVGRGDGTFYCSDGTVNPNYWLAGIWALASLGWPSGKEIAHKWSHKSNRYTDVGFEKAWNSYNPAHPNAIGIGSLYKRAKELGWNQEGSHLLLNITGQQPRFSLLGIDELANLPPTEYLVKGILPCTGVGAIYGPSGSGKTFLALDLMMTIACQLDWFGHKVKNVPVTYVGLEGKGGINNRIKAWCLKNKLTPKNFKVILNNLDLKKSTDVDELASAIQVGNMGSGVVIIDTLNQASPGADENSSIDMGIIINRLQRLQELTGGLVLIVHHTGKNAMQGLRGHSSLKAALDANIEVVGGDNKVMVLEKVKDGECGQRYPFSLAIHTLGEDSDGDPITSCTIEREFNVVFAKPEPSGKRQKLALRIIKQSLENITSKRMTVEAAVSEIANSLTTIASNKRTNSARQLLGSLTTGGHLSSELIKGEGWVWLP